MYYSIHQHILGMCCFAEFFAENMGDFFIFLRRFADEVLESSTENLEQVLNFITVYMGNVERCSKHFDTFFVCTCVSYACYNSSNETMY